MPARKRKVKKDSDDEAPTKRTRGQQDHTATRRAVAPRRTKVNRNDPEWLVTNEKSPLGSGNLHVSCSLMIVAYISNTRNMEPEGSIKLMPSPRPNLAIQRPTKVSPRRIGRTFVQTYRTMCHLHQMDIPLLSNS